MLPVDESCSLSLVGCWTDWNQAVGQHVGDSGGPRQLCGLEIEAGPWDAGPGLPSHLFSSEGAPPTHLGLKTSWPPLSAAAWWSPMHPSRRIPEGPSLEGVLWDLQHTPLSHQRQLHRASLADQRQVLPGLCPRSISLSPPTEPPAQGSRCSSSSCPRPPRVPELRSQQPAASRDEWVHSQFMVVPQRCCLSTSPQRGCNTDSEAQT